MKPRKLLAISLVLESVSTCALLAASAQEASSLDAKQQAGKVVYLQHCVSCHGPNGDGSGTASVWLFPRPRNFNAGLFKIKSTPGTALPTDDDLFNTVTRGLP